MAQASRLWFPPRDDAPRRHALTAVLQCSDRRAVKTVRANAERWNEVENCWDRGAVKAMRSHAERWNEVGIEVGVSPELAN